MKHDIQVIGREFAIYGDFRESYPYGHGHINDTYAAVYDQAGIPVRYIVQRINHNVFKSPEKLMENIRRVTDHLGLKLVGQPDRHRRRLTLVPTLGGQPLHRDADGNVWRVYLFVENARTVDAVESPAQVFQAARAFGQFQAYLMDLPGPRLHDTIPDFHNTPVRFAALEAAIAADVCNRADTARAEIEFALQRKPMTSKLVELQAQGVLPERITHNDTKLNNILLDDVTDEGICVIDLDTTMPGLALYDFGDMVRTATSSAVEGERDLSKIAMQMPMFEALVRGYLETAGSFLTPSEKGLLAFSGKLITFEIGLRFLTDYLAGDVYFKTQRAGQNLDRCRSQFRLVESIEQQEEQINRCVDRV